MGAHEAIGKKLMTHQGVPPVPAFQQASMTVITNQCNHTAIPRRFSMIARDIWDLQIRLERRQPKLIESILEHPKFRAAYDFLVLREQSGENLSAAAQWWTEIQELDKHGRYSMIKLLSSHEGQKNRGNKRRRRKRKPRSDDASSNNQSGEF